MSKGHRSEVPELYCVFASKTLQRKAPSEGCLLLASDKSLPRSRKTPFDLGCSRDTSRGCVGRRCTVLSYTFRSHPYQNTVERGWCSKVFFGLRNNDAYALASQQYTLRTMPSSATMEGIISIEMERSVRRRTLLRATTALKKRKNIGENGIYFVSLQMDVSA